MIYDPAPAPTCGNTASFSAFNGIVLPAELVDFTAVTDGEHAVLQWTTASETNNAGFAIEQQVAGAFHEVGFATGAGTTLQAQDYTFRTDALAPGVHTFRLKQIDFDGSFEYSPMVTATVEATAPFSQVTLYPNPLRGTSTLRFAASTEQEVTVEIYNMLGRLVATPFAGRVGAYEQHVSLDGQALPPGLYALRITGQTVATTKNFAVMR
ncbi:MAG: hypothetical protein RhofKO_16180 [Rhodothermales bacterium]